MKYFGQMGLLGGGLKGGWLRRFSAVDSGSLDDQTSAALPGVNSAGELVDYLLRVIIDVDLKGIQFLAYSLYLRGFVGGRRRCV